MKNVLFKRTAALFFSIALLASMIIHPQALAAEDISQEELQKTIEFRKTFGLPHEKNFVTEQIKKRNESSIKFFGVSLAEDEEALLKKRFKQQDEFVPKVKKLMEEMNVEEEFSGIYVDQENEGLIYIGLKDDEKKEKYNRIKKDIEALYEDKAKIKFYQAKKSENDLDQLSEQLGKELESLKEQGIVIQAYATDFPNGKLNVFVEELTSEKKKILEEQYGKENISVKKAETVGRFSRTAYTRPLMGGLVVVNNSNNIPCTNAFSASRNGYYYTITAAHCDTPTTLESWSQGGVKFGNSSSYKKESGNVDAIALSISSTNRSNQVYGNAYKLTSSQKKINQYVGQAVAKSGMRTAVTTGTIKTTNWSGTVDGISWSGLIGTNATSGPGDSGATVYYNGTLMGVLWGGSSSYPMIYSHVENVLYHLGMTPVLN